MASGESKLPVFIQLINSEINENKFSYKFVKKFQKP